MPPVGAVHLALAGRSHSQESNDTIFSDDSRVPISRSCGVAIRCQEQSWSPVLLLFSAGRFDRWTDGDLSNPQATSLYLRPAAGPRSHRAHLSLDPPGRLAPVDSPVSLG